MASSHDDFIKTEINDPSDIYPYARQNKPDIPSGRLFDVLHLHHVGMVSSKTPAASNAICADSFLDNWICDVCFWCCRSRNRICRTKSRINYTWWNNWLHDKVRINYCVCRGLGGWMCGTILVFTHAIKTCNKIENMLYWDIYRCA